MIRGFSPRDLLRVKPCSENEVGDKKRINRRTTKVCNLESNQQAFSLYALFGNASLVSESIYFTITTETFARSLVNFYCR